MKRVTFSFSVCEVTEASFSPTACVYCIHNQQCAVYVDRTTIVSLHSAGGARRVRGIDKIRDKVRCHL